MTSDPDDQKWLPLAEAADRLGLSRHQLRRRVRAGQIASRQVQGPHGPSYEVSVDDGVTVASASRHANGRHGDATVTVTPPLTELVSLLRETQAQLMQTTAAAAMWQARAEHWQDQVEHLQKALPAPTSTESPLAGPSANAANGMTETSSEARNGRPWWRLFWER